jgi:hypothetical protein
MKTKFETKKGKELGNADFINTDALISDFEFMYRMHRMNMTLDIDVIANTPPKQKR